MGRYLNPGSGRFAEAVGSEVFVDKTAMVSYLNSCVRTNKKYVCVSRPRRFGKTMAADMLCAYYGHGTDARALFSNLKLAKTDPILMRTGEMRAWDAFLGTFDVVRVTVTEFCEDAEDVRDMLNYLTEEVAGELMDAYPDVRYGRRLRLLDVMCRIHAHTGRPFVVVIDEWDAPMRERRDDEEGQRTYLDFLRNWLKDQEFVALAYMTGILPVKKYGAHSALNMFDEYSMVLPLQLAEYTGFTEEEVRALCEEHRMDFGAVRAWYDGYEVTGVVPVKDRDPSGVPVKPPRLSLYAPLSVSRAVSTGQIANFWGGTETYEALADYIRRDFDGLKAAVALMMDGGRVPADLSSYQNDMSTFHSRDDVLALLVHLGYLGWDSLAGEAFVPNQEVMSVFRTSTSEAAWDEAFAEYQESKRLVEATIAGDEAAVASALEAAHNRADNRSYNSEPALSYAVQLAYYAAQRWYTVLPELDSGKGYADVAYLPSPERPDLPALVVELKWNHDARTALDQIRDRQYVGRLGHYEGNILLVGISYDADLKSGSEGYKLHRCLIEHA